MNKSKFNQSYVSSRGDILNIIPEKTKNILDVGCSTGNLGFNIKKKLKAKVSGIEFNHKMGKIAKQKLNKVIIDNVEDDDIQKNFSHQEFDLIIFGDILEHLIDPWKVLRNYTDYLLQSGGFVIFSLPNVRHYDTLFNLIFKAYWPYRERGIHDQTHLRFFTLKNIKEMIKGANLEILTVQRKYRIVERPNNINRFAKYLALPLLKDFFTFQYLILAKKQ